MRPKCPLVAPPPEARPVEVVNEEEVVQSQDRQAPDLAGHGTLGRRGGCLRGFRVPTAAARYQQAAAAGAGATAANHAGSKPGGDSRPNTLAADGGARGLPAMAG